MKTLAILGASGHGKVVADIAAASGDWGNIVFFDDGYPSLNSLETWNVAGNIDDLIEQASSFSGVVVAIGDNSTRYKKHQQLVANGCKIVSLIHPAAVVSSSASISKGTVVMAGAVVNSNSVIGSACIINTNAVVEHDCQLADSVHISPGGLLAGSVTIGRCTWIGIGSCLIQRVSICDNVIVGAGAVIIKDINISGTYAGNPAIRLS